MEQRIGTTDLRQRLTDVLETVREQGTPYIVETFGRPQAVIIDVGMYRQYQRFLQEREAFFDWLEDTAGRNAEHNAGLGDADVMAIIASARDDVAADDHD